MAPERKSLEEQLRGLMDAYEAVHKSLQTVLHTERHCIIHNELNTLPQLNESKCALKETITQLETERTALLHAFARHYGITAQPVRLTDIIAVVPEPYGTLFSEQQKRMRQLLQGIQRMHAANKMLVSRSLDFQERTFMLLFGALHEKVRYEATGKMRHTKKQLIDSVA